MTDKFLEVLAMFVALIGILLIIGFIILEIYVWVKYGTKNITEIPAWALALLFGRN